VYNARGLNTERIKTVEMTRGPELLLLLRPFVTRKIPPRRPQMRCPAVRKCSCLYTMYHINNSVFSSVLKVLRLQSDIHNAVGKLFHTEGPDTAKLLSPESVFVCGIANCWVLAERRRVRLAVTVVGWQWSSGTPEPSHVDTWTPRLQS